MWLARIKKGIDKLLTLLIIVCMTLLVLTVIWQVFSRYIIGAPSTNTDELARYLMIDVAFLGAAYTAGIKQHLAMDFFSSFFSKKLSPKAFRFIYHIFIILFAATAMVYGGTGLMVMANRTGSISPMMELPMSWVYSIIPVSGCFMILYSLISITFECCQNHKSDSSHD